MKLLIMGNGCGSSYITELRSHLEENGVKVDVLDIASLEVSESGNIVRSLVGVRLKKLLPIPKIASVIRIAAIRSFLIKNARKYDVLNIHYAHVLYLFFLRSIKAFAGVNVVSVWGSDFYRSENWVLKGLRKLYRLADAITFTNPKTLTDFVEFYGDYREKSFVIRFGLESLDVISKIREEEPSYEIKDRLGLPPESLVIACGYNSVPAQQHEAMIAALVSISDKLPENVCVLLPMTYPDDNEYKSRIEAMMKESGLRYKIISSKVSREDIARIRIASDIVLNIQTTDAFAASIQEHLFAGSITIVGNWLPYDIYGELGVFFFRIADLAGLKESVIYSVENLEELKALSRKNRDIIYELACWQNNIQKWTGLYRSLINR